MKVGFYITNTSFCNKKYMDFSQGNPGIGGTYYAMLQVVYALSSSRNCDGDSFYLLMESDMSLPDYVSKIITPTINDLSNAIEKLQLDYLVVNKIGPKTLGYDFFDSIRKTKINVIVWIHCSINVRIMNQLSKEPLVTKVVAVSKTQYYTWYDHQLFDKATFIYNMFEMKNPAPLVDYEKRKNSVVYLGAINHVKGVHYITKAWNKVKKVIPDAELYIIGSGKLYSSNQKCGKFGIAENYYEQKLLRPILINDQIDSSVHFLGILGSEKWEVLNRCKIGITNAASWETFGYTMLEMQLAGMQVISKKSPGLIDTMYHGSGILYNNPNRLADYIISLLQNNSYNNTKSIEFAMNRFSSKNIIPEWNNLFHNCIPKRSYSSDIKNINFFYLRLVAMNRRIRKYIPFMPSVTQYKGYIDNVSLYFRYIFNPVDLYNKIVSKLY